MESLSPISLSPSLCRIDQSKSFTPVYRFRKHNQFFFSVSKLCFSNLSTNKKKIGSGFVVRATARGGNGESPYDVLGVSPSATPDQIKKAYRKLALKFHPDVNKQENAQDKFMRIKHAYNTLLNSESRRKYDYGRGASGGYSTSENQRRKGQEEEEFYGFGYLRVFYYSKEQLICGGKSYYGALLCCSWSMDGKYILVGGEDDLVQVWSMDDRKVVAWGEGHSSWVSDVSFDSYWSSPASDGTGENAMYLFGSVGKETQFLLWIIRRQHHSKNKKCFVCNTPTLGMFNADAYHEIR